MAVVGELVVAILGNTAGLDAALGKAEGELKGFTGASESHGNAVGKAGAAVAAGVAAFSIAAVHMAMGFQDAMSTIAVNAHLPEEAVAKLGAAIQTASLGTTSSSTAMAAALGPVAGELQRLSGHALTAKDAVLLLVAAENLHVATGTDLNTATKSITDLLLTYRLHASDAAGVSNLLFAASAQLGTGVETVSGALQKLQPRIAGSGIDLITLLAIAREMEPVVGTGGKAIVKLGSVLQQFLSPSNKAQQVLSDLGVSLTDSQSKFIGFGPAVQVLHDALANLTAPERAAALYALFGKNLNIAGELIKGGAAGLAANTKALTDQGTAAAAAAEKNKDLSAQGKILFTEINDLTASIGGAFLPALSSALAVIQPIINSFAAWVTANPQLAGQLLLVAGALGAVVGAGIYVPAVLTAIKTATLGLITGPILLVVAAVLDLAATFGLLGPQAQEMAESVNGFVAGMVQKVIAWVELMIPQVLARLERLAGQIHSWAESQIPLIVAQVGKWASAFIEWVGPMIPPALAALGEFGGQVVNWIGAQVPGWMAQVGKWASAFMGWVGPMILPALAALGQFASQVANWIVAQVPIWMVQVGKWGQAFMGWVGPMIPPALAALGQFAGSIANWIVAQVTILEAQVGKWPGAFIGWVSPMIPPALAALSQFGGQVANWIGAQVPVWIAQVGKWASAFIGWVGPMIPPMLGALGQWSARVLNWILDQIPVWAKGLMKWADAFVDWVIPMIPPMLFALTMFTGQVLLALAGLGLAIVSWIIGEIPHVVVALATLGWELVAWIAPKIPGMLLALAGLGLAIVSWIITKAIPAAVGALLTLGGKFVSWVADSVPKLLVELGKWLLSLLTWLIGLPAKVMSGAMAIGAAIIKGIIDGIGTVAGAIGAWLFGTPMPAPPTVHPPTAADKAAYSEWATLEAMQNAHAAGLPYIPPPTTTGVAPKMYQHGGVVSGTGAQMAIVHGGETITPAGQGGGAITLVNHTHVSLDGREIMDFVEQQLFRNAGVSSSGFQANNPVTSA